MTYWYGKRPQDFTAEQANICAVIRAIRNRIHITTGPVEAECLWSLLEAAEAALDGTETTFHCKSCGDVLVSEIKAGRCKLGFEVLGQPYPCPLLPR